MQHYTPAEVRQFAGNGKTYYKSFQYEMPDESFTHLNQTPHIRGSSDHTFDNQWNTMYEYYMGNGEIANMFYHKETEPMFAPRKTRQINLNNDWEHVHEQREIYQRSNPQKWHQFERPPGTRLIVGPGIDPFYRQAYGDPNNPGSGYSYQWCPSMDWYRTPELTLEQLRGKTRNNFDITKNVKAGVKPIFHSNLNMFKTTQLRPETFWQNSGDMILPNKASTVRERWNPDNIVRGHTKRTDHPHLNHIKPAFDPTGEHYQPANFAPSLKKLMGIQVPAQAPHGIKAGQLYGDRDHAYKFSNCGHKKEDDQTWTRGRGGVIGTPRPGIFGKLSNKLLTLRKERDLKALAGVSGQVNTPLKKPYLDNAKNPDPTKRESYLDVQARTGNAGNKLITKQTVLDPLSFNLKPTYRYQSTMKGGEYKGNITQLVNGQPVFDRDDKKQLKSTIREQTMHKSRGNITGKAKHKVQNLSEVHRSLGTTRKEQMITDYTATGGGVNANGDPRYYDPESMERDVRKHVYSHNLNDVGPQRFTDGKMQQNRVRQNIYENRPDISSRPWGNVKRPTTAINYNARGGNTRGGGKRPEINSRMF